MESEHDESLFAEAIDGRGPERGALLVALSLSQRRVDLWIVLAREIGDDLLGEYRNLLAPDELKREMRFRFAVDRTPVTTRTPDAKPPARRRLVIRA